MVVISVVIPTYERPKKLSVCLKALAGQTFPSERFEAILVEDSLSEEGRNTVLPFLAKFPSWRYFSQDHRGPAVARNFGIRSAKGKVILFTDDDCEVPPDWIERIVDGYRRYPKAVGVGGYMEAPPEVLEKNNFARYESYQTRIVYKAGEKELLGGFEVPTGGTNNISYRKEVLEEVDGFDESFPVPAGEDADLKKRICDKGYKILYLPLRVIHHHDYNKVSFKNQNRDRGVGSYCFEKKHHLLPPISAVKKRLRRSRFLSLARNLIPLGEEDRSLGRLQALADYYNAQAYLKYRQKEEKRK